MKFFNQQKKKEEPNLQELVNNAIAIDGFQTINKTEEQDIFIASYPKSGNTWMQNLIASMILSSTTNISPKLVGEIVPDIHARRFYKRLYDRMFFKTHSLPNPNYKRVIHLVRDGRDALVSFHHYLKLNNQKGFSYEEMIKDGVGLWPCKWHEHAEAWIDNPFNADILTVRYEDLILDAPAELRKVAVFANIPISEEKIVEICEHNSIDNLRKKVTESGWEYDKKFGKDSKKFFRKGIVGDYKNELDPEIIDMFNSYSAKMLKSFRYDV